MADITVEPSGDNSYLVTVTENGSTTTHEVTVDQGDVEGLTAEAGPERLIEASFRFLLDREPKESILTEFDLSVITRYFPEYPSRIASYL